MTGPRIKIAAVLMLLAGIASAETSGVDFDKPSKGNNSPYAAAAAQASKAPAFQETSCCYSGTDAPTEQHNHIVSNAPSEPCPNEGGTDGQLQNCSYGYPHHWVLFSRLLSQACGCFSGSNGRGYVLNWDKDLWVENGKLVEKLWDYHYSGGEGVAPSYEIALISNVRVDKKTKSLYLQLADGGEKRIGTYGYFRGVRIDKAFTPAVVESIEKKGS